MILRDGKGHYYMGKGNASCHSKNRVLGQVGRVKMAVCCVAETKLSTKNLSSSQ